MQVAIDNNCENTSTRGGRKNIPSVLKGLSKKIKKLFDLLAINNKINKLIAKKEIFNMKKMNFIALIVLIIMVGLVSCTDDNLAPTKTQNGGNSQISTTKSDGNNTTDMVTEKSDISKKKVSNPKEISISQTANSCSATSLMHAIFAPGSVSCSVTCPATETPSCIGGPFSATCTCLKNDPILPDPTLPGGVPEFVIPSYTERDLQAASEFATWCSQYGTANMSNLSNIVNLDMAALIANNQDDFSFYEYQYFLQYEQLTLQEKSDIDDWINSYQI